MYLLPSPKKSLVYRVSTFIGGLKTKFTSKRGKYALAAVLDLAILLIILVNAQKPAQRIIHSLVSPWQSLHSLSEGKKSNYQVFGFAPYWTFEKLANVDFKILTTFAYFGVDVSEDGDLDKSGKGYEIFMSQKATDTFRRAHENGTRVVLTLTQMKNDPILSLLDNPDAQNRAIEQAVTEIKHRGIDGINVDFEFTGNPGQDYRNKFSNFVSRLTARMHQEVPASQVTVSVYAAAVKEPKIYDIGPLSKASDGIFMMAYDFAVAGSDNAIPTAPLYGHKQGKYWYDISTAVDDFLSQMSPDKLILGVPYYGYNYLVYEPTIKAETRPYYSWRGRPKAQTYSIVQENIKPEMDGATDFIDGWDELGQVSWKAYHVEATDTWRMIFLDDVKSLGLKYDFAKNKNLAGVGMWALGFDDGKTELWKLLEDKFGVKFSADNTVKKRVIN